MNRTLKLILINLIVLAVLLEAAAVALYFFQEHRLFYGAGNARAAGDLRDITAERPPTDIRLHPFFGFTQPAGGAGMNNFGFHCRLDLPYVKKGREMVIGIFGGSVAEGFYLNGRDALAAAMRQQPDFSDRDPVFLNFAMGGYKQPQSLQILAYFLSLGQEFDLVILIDGFNEAVFCANNARLSVDISMPSAQHFLPLRDLIDRQTLSRARLRTMAAIASLQERINARRQGMRRAWLAAVFYWHSFWEKRLDRRYQQEVLRFDGQITPARGEDSLLNITYTPVRASLAEVEEKSAALWSRSVLAMARLLAGSNGRFLHFLQPNQYFSRKRFTAAEGRLALNDALPYHRLVAAGYPFFVRQVGELRRLGVASTDATAVFDAVDGAVYIDDCCHYNQGGYEILARFIAARIAPAPGGGG